ncbi:protease inhibitor I42 family protein [Pseudomonas sp. GD04087]|uniref:protease inhibitor I42 family protein n=1 Tax=Pseudomonas TaxID=286 RepID=UPI001F30059C|nr:MULTISPECIES: protease inhibitor I42 family protein [Pseudomonas]MCP1649174.1 inhibitor of cysteine peptidase [Pseudomonas nitroreducens]MCP1684865.1 inhibitor of cysteine peptidase [Pseudomonas nitroreducens]MDH0291516.1 protease inhibitor I42 family protein [Pseudomonas sp. GD04087]MDH1047417.1 protease inhibitor I42 family protein [Pseudomonas sp. GD03903]MDH2001212.1 protease inhibitor I42 family protein [Pseudomonas sp. GD03691]
MPSYRPLLPLTLALLAGCAGQSKPVVTLEDASDCKPLKLHTGQELVLILPSNPTTGFRWELRNAANGLLRALGPEVYSNPEDAGLVGSAGESTWRFRVTAAGEDTLELAYRRPWEAEVAPAQTFVCPIAVK